MNREFTQAIANAGRNQAKGKIRAEGHKQLRGKIIDAKKNIQYQVLVG
ncbi:hypothetical protein GNF10_18915 [Nostoc sp. UCD121]|nr:MULTISPECIES: hypothetical protein [unclassified Nostoc]MBC1224908.1 hypothetical protein [Nostoc sp. UCD120]MBC1277971.1 hypothetical protein [Nostoc sp. UCD121]MBC1294902.1 hypothetical protein [Nostoc sp. UCD122]